MTEIIKILAIGDIVGRGGRQILGEKLNLLKRNRGVDMVIANGENAAAGISLTPDTAREIFGTGVDVITTGNHIWGNNEITKIIDSEPHLLRPANYPDGVRGRGYGLYTVAGIRICVINLMGRLLMEALDCPFRKFDEIFSKVSEEAKIIIVDFHAEATSEKRAFGWYVAGRASAVFGTHTHVQTADEEILSGGTGYISDIGMTGALDSVIGMDKNVSIQRFLTQTRVKFKTASENLKISGAIFHIKPGEGAVKVERVLIGERMTADSIA